LSDDAGQDDAGQTKQPRDLSEYGDRRSNPQRANFLPGSFGGQVWSPRLPSRHGRTRIYLSYRGPPGYNVKGGIMDWSDCEMVEVVPGRLNGRPVVKDTRVAADTVWESAELGSTAEEIASDYRLKVTDVQALLAYAASHPDHAPVS